MIVIKFITFVQHDIRTVKSCLAGHFDLLCILTNVQDKYWLSQKVRKTAKIRNQYNQVPHLTQDTMGK